jgi:aryl-alcohol dehydrogenase-like predicted oxidoreductase
MQTRIVGSSDLEVSEIALGSWLTYSVGLGRDQTEACTRAAFDAGITLFDTSNSYGHGSAEEVWGEILSGYSRESYVLATKAFYPLNEQHAGGLSAAEIHEQIDASLRRLRTDYVDIYYCHRFDVETPIEETMEALTEVAQAGKARYLGFSEWTPEQIEAALAVPGATRFVASQPQYNMLWQSPEADVFPLSVKHGIGQLVWSSLAQGVLTGKYRPGQPPPEQSRAASEEMGFAIGRWLNEPVLNAVAELSTIADQAGLPMTHLALAWVLRRPEVSSAIIGASRPEQVHDNAAASGVTLSRDVLEAVDRCLAGVADVEPRLAYGAKPGVLHRADVV